APEDRVVGVERRAHRDAAVVGGGLDEDLVEARARLDGVIHEPVEADAARDHEAARPGLRADVRAERHADRFQLALQARGDVAVRSLERRLGPSGGTKSPFDLVAVVAPAPRTVRIAGVADR